MYYILLNKIWCGSWAIFLQYLMLGRLMDPSIMTESISKFEQHTKQYILEDLLVGLYSLKLIAIISWTWSLMMFVSCQTIPSFRL